MNVSNIIRLSGATSSPDIPDAGTLFDPVEQDRKTAMEAMQIYTDAGLAEWVSHEHCPQLHFTDGRIFIFGPYGVTRLA
ncbi:MULTISPECIES: hypothetical protein [unclassified Serratia (in: enterobacteria)]|uniref:hypothetical protein n=1 Tax=unclassified Serratia (in: enterobacteria) TaxID=2647522 RepID=UPI0024AF51AD|nr:MULTISPECIES: hypothetical protein [unclassified Serratia (in: enterobacteria)]MDI6935088.1 hypothetical protein [Serratia sp. Se-PFBMAAmG]MDI6949537.1 hypothetical protein [Serratia sp. Se-RSmG]MDI6978488.1 hypothetical protein [Serratia sp. Se-RSBMAAmG]